MRRALAILIAGVVSACTTAAAPEAKFTETPLTTVTSREGTLRIAVFTSPEQPPSRGTIVAKLMATAVSNGSAVDGLRFDIAPEMPSMGHGTPTVPRVSAMGGGVYLAEDVNLYMAGRWDLRMTITGAVTDDAVVPLDVR